MDKKKIMWSILSLLLAALTIFAIIAQDRYFSPIYLYNFIKIADKRFLILALISMCGYFFFEGYALARMAHLMGIKASRTGLMYGAADVYFSAITPSASGGQPAAAFFMVRDGIPIAAATVMLLMNLVMYTLSIIVFGGFTFITSLETFVNFSFLSKVLIIIGTTIITFLGLMFVLLLYKSSILKKIGEILIDFLARLKIIKNPDRYRQSLVRKIKEYENCSNLLLGKKRLVAEVFALNMLQRFFQLLTAPLIFLSAGYGWGVVKRVWYIQNYTVLGSNCIPIPGAMGVADYIMLDGYDQILQIHGVKAELELLCRAVSFYGCIVLCGIILIVGYVIRKKRNR